jgi:hypothetical protein
MEAGPHADMFDIVDTFARLIGGPATVADLDFRVLAYSTLPDQANDEARRSAILNRRTPDTWLRWMEESGVRDELLRSRTLVRLDIPWTTFLPRYIQPIRAGDQLVGYLWVMQSGATLADDAAKTAKEFADLLAPELASRSSALTENPGGSVLRQFFSGGLPASRVASVLDVNENAPTVVIAVAADAAKSDAVLVRHRAVRAIALYIEIHLRGAIVGVVDQRIYVLCAAPTLDESALDPLLARFVKHLVDAAEIGASVAASAVHPGLAAADAARVEADLALHVVASRTAGRRVGRFNALRHEIVLNETVDFLKSRPALTDGILDRLRDHDRRHNSDYMDTLNVYLNSFGDMRWAADQLHLHPNSLRYRVKRLAEIADFDLDDPRLRLALSLVMRTATVGDKRAGSPDS